MQDLPENHFRVSGASWVNIINYLTNFSMKELVTMSRETNSKK